MERITRLREQARVLRALAASFDVPSIREQLLELAVRCEAMAKDWEENPQAAGIKFQAARGEDSPSLRRREN